MHGKELKEAKARVDELVIDVLEFDGIIRKRGVSLATHEAYLVEVRNRLAYMTGENLQVMRGIISRNALGSARNVWPGMISIKNWAHALQDQPLTDSRLVSSYMASVAGRAAWDRSPEEAVALRRYLKKNGRPPAGDFDWNSIKAQANEWRRDIDRLKELGARRGLDTNESNRLEAWRSMRDRVRVLVFGSRQQEGAEA